MSLYYRPILHTHPFRPKGAKPLAGGWTWFDMVEGITRDGVSRPIHISDLPGDILENLTAPRANIAGLEFSAPRLMGVLNVTPDSFSDGGQHNSPDRALKHARAMAHAGADMIDVGGESTRPGAALIAEDEEITRTAPVIAALTAELDVPISIDTRKTAVARAAHQAGVALVNDVAGFTFTPDLAPFCAKTRLPVCIMHAQGTPEIMQNGPRYDHVALDVYDYLEARIEALTALGIPRTQIIIDPGIGFGK
ncbi:Dihydropteroate synthase, partial [hydrothermal vent metagenome]